MTAAPWGGERPYLSCIAMQKDGRACTVRHVNSEVSGRSHCIIHQHSTHPQTTPETSSLIAPAPAQDPNTPQPYARTHRGNMRPQYPLPLVTDCVQKKDSWFARSIGSVLAT